MDRPNKTHEDAHPVVRLPLDRWIADTLPGEVLVPKAKIDFQIPVADNNRVEFAKADYDELHRALVRLAGGFTRDGLKLGGWDGGPDGEEPHWGYWVCVEPKDAIRAAGLIEAWIKGWFRQYAACIVVTTVMTTRM